MSYSLTYLQSAGAGAVGASAGLLHSVIVSAAAGNAASVDLRDAAAGSGTKKIATITVLAGDTKQVILGGYKVTTGVYVEAFTGTGAIATLVYQ